MTAEPAPRTSLRRVLGDLGRTVLDLAVGGPRDPDEVGGVAIHDPHDEPILPPRAIVLGIAVQGSEQIAELLDQLAAWDVAALVVRAPVPVDELVTDAAERTGIAVLGLTRGASWTQIAALLRSLLADDDIGANTPETLGGAPAGDLFALANAVSALLDAPVTIEDRGSRVLAFSNRQNEADVSRVETVLGRQVPERYTKALEERGVFHRLYREEGPVFVDSATIDLPEVGLSRTAVAIRAGDEILGSMWAATEQPLSDQRRQAFLESSRLVALHLLRQRAGADVTRRARADLLGTVLRGEKGAGEAAGRLGITQGVCTVLAVGVLGEQDSGPEVNLEANRLRVADAFALHLSAAHPRAASALIGGVTYGILPLDSRATDRGAAAVRIAREFLARTAPQFHLAVGIGRVADGLAAVHHSRTDADRVLRVLYRRERTPRVATIEELHTDALLLELADMVAAEGYGEFGVLASLLDYDRRRGGELTETLRAWLDAFGDVAEAAERVNVHQNTFRYRLRRISEVSGLDLGDSDARFAAMIQLRLLDQ